jgi:UDP-N-acetylglucosamine--N-acetylmuramyl-(pentapeptide) pyrophosphoryl-undecaprenol N-acetylglucosamine transferase
VPLPRKPSADLLRLPGRVRGAVARVREVLRDVSADVVVGFGGYVALPAYLGARGRVPIVVHEANARAGLANKVGARFAARVVAAVPGSGLADAEVLGIPLRRAVTTLDRAGLRAQAREKFGLPALGPVLLVFGGSQGARSLNNAVAAALPGLVAAGVAVLHAHGRRHSPVPPAAPPVPGYVPLPYIDDMHLAYAAADAVLCRAGAMTVAEVSAVGLPAVYVPLPHGNGEQALNAGPVVAAGGGVLVADADLTGDRVLAELAPLLADPARLAAMGAAARASGHADADERLARVVLDVVGVRA